MMHYSTQRDVLGWNAVRFLEQRDAPRSVISALRRSFGPRSHRVSKFIDERCAVGISRYPGLAETIIEETEWTRIRNPSSYFTSKFNAECSGRVTCRCYRYMGGTKCMESVHITPDLDQTSEEDVEEEQEQERLSINGSEKGMRAWKGCRHSIFSRLASHTVNEKSRSWPEHNESGECGISQCDRREDIDLNNEQTSTTDVMTTSGSRHEKIPKRRHESEEIQTRGQTFLDMDSADPLPKKAKTSNCGKASRVKAEYFDSGKTLYIPLEFQDLASRSRKVQPDRKTRNPLPLLDEKPGMPCATLRLFGRSIPLSRIASVCQ